jgi:hypothetical protein
MEGAERFLEQALREVLRIARRGHGAYPEDRHRKMQVTQIEGVVADALAELDHGRFNEPLPPLHPEHVTGAVKGRHIA